MSVLERCPLYRGHEYYVTLKAVPGVQIVERGGQRVKLYTSIFFLHEFFSRALLSERLKQELIVKARKMFKAQFDKIHQIL